MFFYDAYNFHGIGFLEIGENGCIVFNVVECSCVWNRDTSHL